MTDSKPMTVEERLGVWAKQPGAFVTNLEFDFIGLMRLAAARGVGYGWMQQVIEWEWLSKGSGAWGPMYFEAQRKELKTEIERLREALESIEAWGADTLSGRVDGPDDRAWQREGVKEMTKRAREALSKRALDQGE